MRIENGRVDITDLPITNGFQYFDISAISKPIEISFIVEPMPFLNVADIVTINGKQYRILHSDLCNYSLRLRVEPVE